MVMGTFTSQGYTIDVRLEPDSGLLGARVVGQVLDVSGNPTPMSAIPVLLVSNGKIVNRTMTCRFGEFLAEGLPQDALELYVMVDPANCIQLPLQSPSQTSPEPALVN